MKYDEDYIPPVTHDELVELYAYVLDSNTKQAIQKFGEQDLKNYKYCYETQEIWSADQKIGGIGGYCMPADPTRNPFPAGVNRDLYRPLQYVRSQFDKSDIRIFARNAVEMTGMHLEAVCRLVLQTSNTLGNIRYSGTTLGKAVHKIEKLKVYDEKTIKALFGFVAIYNRSKHEINQDEGRARMFNEFDALVAYFSARILGVILLKGIEIEESFEVYEICGD